MARALIDTTVLFAGAYRRDDTHESGLAILKGVDAGRLPEGVVLDYVLAETCNGLTSRTSHEVAVDLLNRIEENAYFEVESVTDATLAKGKQVFRNSPHFSFVDACLVAYAETNGVDYLYSFDDDFDGSGITRLDIPTNPFDSR